MGRDRKKALQCHKWLCRGPVFQVTIHKRNDVIFLAARLERTMA